MEIAYYLLYLKQCSIVAAHCPHDKPARLHLTSLNGLCNTSVFDRLACCLKLFMRRDEGQDRSSNKRTLSLCNHRLSKKNACQEYLFLHRAIFVNNGNHFFDNPLSFSE
uniref:Uncharacterized protein n=1 Tax=Parascaris univalens TaxID=6257 RepID=A0A915A3A0_PARUN